MLIDIHRHSIDKGLANVVMQNIFHSETNQIEPTGFYSVGLHPWHVEASTLIEDIEKIKETANQINVIAIGEAGIDKATQTNLTLQKIAFEAQIAIAKDAKKPMIIHCVRAYDEILHYRKSSNHHKPWIIHWFNASKETAFDLIGKNCYLSFGHMLFNENSKAYKSFKHVPIEHVFFETDDVGISISEVYTRAAQLKNIPLENLKEQIQTNFKNCFGIAI